MFDYRKIIRTRNARMALLNLFAFIPDEMMIRFQYRYKTGRKLNLSDPQRFSEKLQWYKLHYREPVMRTCADKAEVKKYVEKQGLGDIVIPTYGVYESASQIDFDSLPSQFVAKDTLGFGSSEIILCRDKAAMDRAAFIRETDQWTRRNPSYRTGGREWPYGGKHRIIIEQLLESDSPYGLIEYKFLCFRGEIGCMYTVDSHVLHGSENIGYYSPDFEPLKAHRKGIGQGSALEKPENFDRMKQIAGILSKPFPHAGIDLYNLNGKIYFGEITFFTYSGYMSYEPDSFDYELGKKFILPGK